MSSDRGTVRFSFFSEKHARLLDATRSVRSAVSNTVPFLPVGDVEFSEHHGGELVAEVLRAHGVRFLFTLTGGHISPILVAAKQAGIRVVDVRHEATAVFAADAVARLRWQTVRRTATSERLDVCVCVCVCVPAVVFLCLALEQSWWNWSRFLEPLSLRVCSAPCMLAAVAWWASRR